MNQSKEFVLDGNYVGKGYREYITVRSHGQNVFRASKAVAIYHGMGYTTYVFTCPKSANRWFKWVLRKTETLPFTYNFEFKTE